MVTNAFEREDRPNFTKWLDSKDVAKFVVWLINRPEYEKLNLAGAKIKKIQHNDSEFDGVEVYVETPSGEKDLIRITNLEVFSERKRFAFHDEYFILFMYNALAKSGQHNKWKDVYVGQNAYNNYSTIYERANDFEAMSTREMPLEVYPKRCRSRKIVNEIKAVLKSKQIKRAFTYDVESYVNRILGLGAPEDAPGWDD